MSGQEKAECIGGNRMGMARPARFERATVRLEGGCSIQLSYGRYSLSHNLLHTRKPKSQGVVPAGLEISPASHRRPNPTPATSRPASGAGGHPAPLNGRRQSPPRATVSDTGGIENEQDAVTRSTARPPTSWSPTRTLYPGLILSRFPTSAIRDHVRGPDSDAHSSGHHSSGHLEPATPTGTVSPSPVPEAQPTVEMGPKRQGRHWMVLLALLFATGIRSELAAQAYTNDVDLDSLSLSIGSTQKGNFWSPPNEHHKVPN